MKRFLQAILGAFARQVVARKKPVIIAVTGSVGKSSTKEAVFTVLAEKFHVHRTPGNLNNEIGLPLAILDIPQPKNKFKWPLVIIKAAWEALFPGNYYEALVLEFGIDHPGDMSYLCRIAPPAIAVVTAVEKVHVTYFKDLGELSHEKEMLLNLLKPGSLAVVNYDNDATREMIGRHKELNMRTFGLNKRADVWADDVAVTLKHTTGIIHDNKDEKEMAFSLNLIGKHQVYTILPAIIIGKHFGISMETMAKRLEHIEQLPGRLTVLEGINGSTLLDSSYNAEPASMKVSLEALHALPAKRKVAILGDMLELGDFSREEHIAVGKKLNTIASLVVLVGQEMLYAYNYLKNMPRNQLACFHFHSSREATEFIEGKIREGDLVLIKGSQSMRMEYIVKTLLKDSEDANLLVRQSEAWQKK